MIHLLLYEAFRSKGISNTLKFLSDKGIGKDSFLNELKNILEIYKFPISEITDDDIHYMSSIKAKNIKVPNNYEIMNPWGIYAIKLWFSLDEGFLTKSGIGYSIFDKLDDEQIAIIKEKFGYNKGKLVNIQNLNNLKTGDIIFGNFKMVKSNLHFTKAIVFKEKDTYYAIQDVSNGNNPSSSEWRKYGKYSWSMGKNKLNEDTSSLYLWIDNEKDLEISFTSKIETNLFINKDGSLYNYDQDTIEKEIKKSDFALVIYLDNLIKYDSVGDIRDERKNIKLGAISLMSDAEIKMINYDKYINSLFKRRGIHKDSKYDDLKDLQTIVSKFLLNEWVLITLFSKVPDYKDKIINFYNKLESLIMNDKKEYHLDILLDYYDRSLKNCYYYRNKFITSKEMVMNNGNEKTISLFKEFIKLSEYLKDKIKLTKIDTIDDVVILLYKLNSISEYLNSDRAELVQGFHGALKNFHYADSDIVYYINEYNEYSEEYHDKNMMKINLIKRFIDKTL